MPIRIVSDPYLAESAVRIRIGTGSIRVSPYFTLPHRFQVESTWSQVDLWTPDGLQVGYLYQGALPNYRSKSTWNPPEIHLDSRWTMWTVWTPLHLMHMMQRKWTPSGVHLDSCPKMTILVNR
jgi:hypothetical protein